MSLSNFVNGMKNIWSGTLIGTEKDYIDYVIPTIINGNIPFDLKNSDQIATVYTCVKILSDTLSRMPLNVMTDEGEGRTTSKEHYLYPILHYNPNSWTSQQTFFSSLEYWRNLKGNSFARIYRNPDGKVRSLVLIPPSRVIGYAVTGEELYYTIRNDKNEDEVLNASEILHFRALTRDGIWGINPVEALRLNLSTTWQGLTTIDSFYKNNASSPKAIKSTVPIGSQKPMIEALNEYMVKYSGALQAGKMSIMPPNTDFVDMALNFVDAELISTLKFNAQQIAALYGVPPHMVGELTATKFNNVEMMLLDFKASTLAAIARAYRQEMEFKLLSSVERINGVSIEFNFDALVEVDSQTRISNLKTLQSTGAITVNDICKIEGWPIVGDIGEARLVPGNYLDLKDIVNKQPQIK